MKYIYERCYGKHITNNLLVKGQESEELELKENIEIALKNCLIRESACRNCLNPQHQDFPGFCGRIEYDKNNKITNKDIIILGQEVSPKRSILEAFNNYPNVDWSIIHIWYELGYFKEHEINKLMKSAPLWEIIDLFFPLSQNIERMYGTDLAKCYFEEEKDRIFSYKACTPFLFEELNCFKDAGLIIISQGVKVKNYLKKYFDLTPDKDFIRFLKENQDDFENFKIKPNKKGEFPFEVGTFISKEAEEINKTGKYLQIYHSSERMKRTFWSKVLKNKYKGVLKEMIFRITEYF